MANRTAFEQLETKILKGKYFRVTGGCVIDTDEAKISGLVGFTWTVDEFEGKDYIYHRKSVEDEEWSDLFCEADVWSVANYDGVTRFEFGSTVERDGKSVDVTYTHSKKMRESRKPCLPEHKKLSCGLCAVALDDEWFIEYFWMPDDFLANEYEDFTAGNLSEDEYRELYEAELKQCLIDGYRAIGYDAADWWYQESNDR